MVEREEERGEDAATEQARVSFKLPVFARGIDPDGRAFAYVTTVENMTRRGAFVRLDPALRPGDAFSLFSPDDDQRKLCDMEVVWSNDGGGDRTVGVGARLLGDNDAWMAFLVERSVRAAEGELPAQY